MGWISSADAAKILSENSGRSISAHYVRALAQKGLIRHRVNPKDQSVNQYWREDVAARKVRLRTAKFRTSEGEEKPYAMSV